ncbi:hypothetical protein PTKIN_Ptkin04bG0201300 [Pterospermum kingtungense]
MNLVVFCDLTDAISRLLSPLSEIKADAHPDLWENLITTVLNLSLYDDNNKRLIAETPRAIPFLVESVQHGTIETRSNAVATLKSLSTLKSNQYRIGNFGAHMALVELLCEGYPLAIKNAAEAILTLCDLPVNTEKVNDIYNESDHAEYPLGCVWFGEFKFTFEKLN